MKNILKSATALIGGTAVAGAALHLVNKAMHKDICMIAHRGHSGVHLGNTEAAFLSAVQNGSGGIETDVRVTADGIFVVNHNDEVTYEDGTQLIVADHTFEELTEKPMKNTLSQEVCYLCTFQRYLEICREGNMVCFIEFKGSFTDEMIHKAFTMAAEVYDLRMCELQSFHFDNLVRAHEAFPELKIMLTCGKHDADVDRALEYGFDIDMDYKGIEAETVKQFHDAGLLVGLWTANTKEALDFCLGTNVDFIESDVFANEKGE